MLGADCKICVPQNLFISSPLTITLHSSVPGFTNSEP